MENMDSTVIATSLPAIAADIGESPLALKLALTSYLVGLAVFIPISGWVADRLGSRTVFASAIVVFVAGSLLCAVSSTLVAFVAARFLQGIGGAMMVPVGRLVLLRAVPKDELPGIGLSVLMLGLSSLGGHLLPGKITAACIVLGALALAAYPWHARRVAHPVIDLSLFALPTFHTGVIAGSLFRIGVGATPFLLPLLLQVGFGMNPLQSGLLTCATAVGAMFMKTLTTVILRRFGFRKVLTVNAVVASAAIGVFGLFTAATPHLVIFLVLLASGCLRSLQFTALQAVSFAEVTRETMSQASSIASMAQRLAQSLGVAFGAYALQISSLAQGHADIVTADFAPAFGAVALLSAASLFFHAALLPGAGAEVSGHGRGK